MTIPVWPDDLPAQSIVPAFQGSARGNRLLTSTDTGPGKQRKRGPALRPVSCAMQVTRDQRARFDRFYEEELNFGVTPFLIPDQQLDGVEADDPDANELLDPDGNPVLIGSWWLVQFGQKQPTPNAISDWLFTISFDLVVLP